MVPFPVLAALLFSSCDPPRETTPLLSGQSADESKTPAPLAAARWEIAREKHASGNPGEALVLLASALTGDPSHSGVRALARSILLETVWHAPEITLEHGFPVDRLEISEEGDLWVSLANGFSTTVRWDMESLSIASVLFPVAANGTRSLVADPGHRFMVIQRDDIVLLCDARTLKPIREIGTLPDALTPSSVIVFSPDGLLLAHPASGGNESPVTWHIRDSSTGEILRSREENPEEFPPIAAHLDRQRLRLFASDGSLTDIPVSPVEEAVTTPPPESTRGFLHAHFPGDGDSAWVAADRGLHENPDLSILSFGGNIRENQTAADLLHRHSWNHHPTLWSGLFRDAGNPPIAMAENQLRISGISHAPIASDFPITAALAGSRVVTADSSGKVTFHRLLPLPSHLENPPADIPPDASHAAEFAKLALALTGLEREENPATFTQVDIARRQAALDDCNPETLAALFPDLDLAPTIEAFQTLHPRTAGGEALSPLHARIARAGFSNEPAAPPRFFTRTIGEVFESGDPEAIEAAIRSSGGIGHDAATALALALVSDQPSWIRACIETAEDLPPLLQRVALSREAWLEGRKGDALAGWHETFPELSEIRLREDWDGWEQADFSPAVDLLKQAVQTELAALKLPPAPSPGQRQTLLSHLSAPETLAIVGRNRLASACLDAALAFAAFPEESENTFRLANIARHLGAPAAPCLRAEALALTAMGDFRKAQPCWITLITEHPVETHQPGDYAEAAYTSFENDDSRQALEILATGMRRFPEDGAFAIRAGWVALLIGNDERAYEFLLAGEQIGFPEDKLENGVALLAIATSRCGYGEDAESCYEALIMLDPAWLDPETIETLEWPEDLKTTLRQLSWGPLPPP